MSYYEEQQAYHDAQAERWRKENLEASFKRDEALRQTALKNGNKPSNLRGGSGSIISYDDGRRATWLGKAFLIIGALLFLTGFFFGTELMRWADGSYGGLLNPFIMMIAGGIMVALPVLDKHLRKVGYVAAAMFLFNAGYAADEAGESVFALSNISVISWLMALAIVIGFRVFAGMLIRQKFEGRFRTD